MPGEADREALRDALKDYTDEGFSAIRRSLDQFRTEFHDYIGSLHVEIDRRFTESGDQVKTALIAQEKALRVKQEADEKALDLARQIQTYKDEQHNGLLKQLGEERATYVTQDQQQALEAKYDAQIVPLQNFMVSQIAAGAGVRDYRGAEYSARGLAAQERSARVVSVGRANFAAAVAVISVVAAIVFGILLAVWHR